jgi:lysophospholipase L1-like esterase
MTLTESAGSHQNEDVSLNFDVYDASAGATDSWIFFGDSITAGGMTLRSACSPSCPSADGSFGQLVARARPEYTPAQCNGGMGGTRAEDALLLIDDWLAAFPGRFVTLNFGTNHAGGGCDVACADHFQNLMRQLIARVHDTGRVAVIPKIPWARSSWYRADIPALNARIDLLYAEFPQVVRGPDFWTYFQANPSLISNDDLHPNAAGYFQMKKLWADTMAGSGGAYGP